ncbi:MAG: PIN domain-containing protein [Acidobacteria bacterium]|nr:MAG: PIN domain-containing protein [Acidobacteriota bacterium]REK09358.1 MAG: PIN domain-containing protein [Acidobacteriota bacterium]
MAVVDSGPLIAALNRADPHHRSCLEILTSLRHDVVVPALCVAEVAYLIGRRLGAEVEASFLAGLQALDVQGPSPEDWPPVAELVRRFADLPLGGTDASVVVLAERLEADHLVTLDRCHFSVVRPRGVEVLFPKRGG